LVYIYITGIGSLTDYSPMCVLCIAFTLSQMMMSF